MKKLTNKIISCILVLSIVLTMSTTAFAAEDNNDYTSGVIAELEDESVESIIRETYATLSPEMQTRVLQVIESNPELREYYQEEIDPNISWQNYTSKVRVGRSVAARAASNDPIKNIERRLSKAGIPTPVVTEAILLAGALVMATADGPLPFGDAVAVYRGTKFAVVLGKNWKIVAPLFGTIAMIFKDELGNTVSGITKLFKQAKADAEKEADKSEGKKEEKKDSDDLQKFKNKIPNKLKDKKGNVDLSKFKKRVTQDRKVGYEEDVTGKRGESKKITLKIAELEGIRASGNLKRRDNLHMDVLSTIELQHLVQTVKFLESNGGNASVFEL